MMVANVPAKDRKLVIVGDSAFAEIACEYFTHDSPYEVVAFAVERAFLKRDTLMGRSVIAFSWDARLSRSRR
jgi:ssRNA-specific RNase YbeY (16S rRNA maturation enzyme)